MAPPPWVSAAYPKVPACLVELTRTLIRGNDRVQGRPSAGEAEPLPGTIISASGDSDFDCSLVN